MIERLLLNTILSRWDSGKVLVILGARQVGKTALIQSICESKGTISTLTGDDIPTRIQLENIDRLMEQKRDLANLIVSKGEKWIGDLTDMEIEGLVGLRK